MKFLGAFVVLVIAVLFCAVDGANLALARGAGGGSGAGAGAIADAASGIFSTAFSGASGGAGPVSVDALQAAISKLLCSNEQLSQQIPALSTLCKTLSSNLSNPLSMLPGVGNPIGNLPF